MSIVTLPCRSEHRAAVTFHIWKIYSDRVFIGDLRTDWNGYASIASAAKEVCQHCHTQYGNKRVVYCKTIGWQWRELVHENGAFVAMAPYRDGVPLGVIGAWLFRSPGAG